MPSPLPIDALLPEIVAALRERPALVIQAEPGAGKTTRVPPALLEAGVGDGEILVAQPRRIAARMAAHRVAHELGEPVGRRCGYQVRFESKVSEHTRIRFVTEGLLARRMRDDPELRGVAMVILDEIHERHVDTDVCLALARRMQRGPRPDLRVVAMSATLDADPLAAFLETRAIVCPGRTFPVAVQYAASDRPIQTQVANALRSVADDLDGSVLVFLPGAREIRQSAQACAPIADAHGIDVVTLHGDLPAKEQDRAVSPGTRPKLILSTNVAETSVTIDGVAVVIDSGLSRRPSHDPWSGVPTLTLAKISQASAIQRAGRAGRTRPGRCIRLYAEHDFARRPEHESPELHRLDLADAMLDLRAAGLRHADELAWLQPPPKAAVTAADSLLASLGAIDGDGALTQTGRKMLRYPTHPRLARLLVEARARGVAELGAGAAALLGERSIRLRGAAASQRDAPADVLADLADFRAARRDTTVMRRLDRNAVHAVDRVRRQLLGLVGRGRERDDNAEDELCTALLVAFPDRVARAERRPGRPDRLVFAAGGDAELSPESVVHGADLVVALAVEQRQDGTRTKTTVRSAAHIEAEWLLEVSGDRLTESPRVRFDAARGRVEAVNETRYDGLLIEATPVSELPPEATAVLRDAALEAGPRQFVARTDDYDALLKRAAFVAKHRPALTLPDETLARATLSAMCDGARSFADLRRADLVGQLVGGLDTAARQAMQQLAPTHVSLAGGRKLRVQYESDRDPWVQSRLQDFFGATTGPSVLGGSLPLVLHLLAPNQRAVQVTTDLAGFWDRHYPDLRKALMRRYPKHDWPEDPRTAKPPAPRPRRKRR
ncbi:MAG: ATP-dependent helicase HrpB [Myxococcota bacterium]